MHYVFFIQINRYCLVIPCGEIDHCEALQWHTGRESASKNKSATIQCITLLPDKALLIS